MSTNGSSKRLVGLRQCCTTCFIGEAQPTRELSLSNHRGRFILSGNNSYSMGGLGDTRVQYK